MTRPTDAEIALLTADRYAAPAAADPLARLVLREDDLVGAALAAEGMRCRRVAWSRPDVDWSSFRAALFRTTWDYFDRFPEFAAWVDRTARATTLINPADVVRWNWDKRYLIDLARRGVAIPPTIVLEPGTRMTLAEAVARTGWPELVLKPAVSGAARHTYRVTLAGAAELDPVFQRLLADEALLLQPFQTVVVDRGELSLVVIGGRVTHAVRKVAKSGDFRVQDDHGGTTHPHTPAPAEVAFAEACVAACPHRPLYARVDLVPDDSGRLTLMELELIEPELFFRFHPPAAQMLAKAVATFLKTGEV